MLVVGLLLGQEHPVSILRMEQLAPEVGTRLPFLRCVPEELLILRADVGRAVAGASLSLDVDDGGDLLGQRLELHGLGPELGLEALLLRDVDVEPLDVGGVAVLVLDDRALVTDPHDAAVGPDHPVLERERVRRPDRLADPSLRLVTILGVQVRLPTRRR